MNDWYHGGADMNCVDGVVEVFPLTSSHDNARGDVINLGGTSRSLRQIAETTVPGARSDAGALHPCSEDLKRIHIGGFEMNCAETAECLAWRPCVEMHEVIRENVAYHREHKAQYWSAL